MENFVYSINKYSNFMCEYLVDEIVFLDYKYKYKINVCSFSIKISRCKSSFLHVNVSRLHKLGSIIFSICFTVSTLFRK